MRSVATLGSHCALQLLKGAKDEGLRTVLVCERGRLGLYGRYPFIDVTVPVDSFAEVAGQECRRVLAENKSVLVPHGTLVAQLGESEISSIEAPVFGNRRMLRWESDRVLKEKLMREAGLRVPDPVASPADISGPVIAKRQGAAGGRGYFVSSTPQEYEEKRAALVSDGTISDGEELYLQRYVPGVLAYLQYFYSPLHGRLEFFGADQRHESDIEGLARIPAAQQPGSGWTPSFNVIGNSPIVLRESLLDGAYRMGESFVEASGRLVGPGMNGPFCIEGVYGADASFTSFEFSARIVAGTSVYMGGSPYYGLLFGEEMSMGRRIAREIREADESGRLGEVAF
ncbi:5-formaminoimidazole-4-carboxamide-1-(beta)-D-ribofuranosyl 5'-monophosphate synthetase [Nitrosopumilaceae archaeon]|nr:formate--phosphoribosylaminoimidazolecarboxamide ligase [Nitrosopumilus sp.]CAI9831311.1 5-formaminoimidazole-4-carboxamide-1-(beta)-D-ribofuranosyl 5'-monophosphate synthetase [Nitrosopumilaceae archaeon]MDA7940949.1 formate--phosphoribosylaminoimidazolecarboxamide ligase [Nitrosopumilus sp.]MDA7943195.1 formate--phosphoribosylaminoimidazolecarboxamide ligase [Nitrosopumilus sp.]MDA7944312.1 formate--phosphoribosylaminoimidazolecarboxamide ligase [Nitrosopumilus sp.]